MMPKDFVKAIRNDVIDSNLEIYRNLFEDTKMESVTENYWKEALSFYDCLDGENKEKFYKIVRQVMVDTISNMFAVIDGVSFLNGQEKEFDFSYLGERINGDLQALFLELEENEE